MNAVKFDEQAKAWIWNTEEGNLLSWQPYLLTVCENICKAVGYGYDFSVWENSTDLRFLLMCNCLPAAWYRPDYASALPHWTVAEFFEHLELFTGLQFDIDHSAKEIIARDTSSYMNDMPVVNLENVVDELSVTLSVSTDSDSGSCDYLGARNLGYEEANHSMSPFYSCDWFIYDENFRYWTAETINDMLAKWDRILFTLGDNPIFNGGFGNIRYPNIDDDPKRFYLRPCFCKEVNRFFTPMTVNPHVSIAFLMVKPDQKGYQCRWDNIIMPVNGMGNRIVDKERLDDVDTISIIPVCVDYTDEEFGLMMSLTTGDYSNDSESNQAARPEGACSEERKEWLEQWQHSVISRLKAGEKEKKSEFFDKIYVGFWDGILDIRALAESHHQVPFPYVDHVTITPDWIAVRKPFSLSLVDGCNRYLSTFKKIDPAIKYVFKFLADDVPDPRSVFHIKGKRYICEKITATFTENGLSELMKGEFYPLIDD